MSQVEKISKTVLLDDGTIKDHIHLQTTNYNEYIANLFLLFNEYNIEFTILKLAKILVAALVRGDHEFAEYLMHNQRYDLPVILKTCEILDSRRLCKQMEAKTIKIKDPKKLSKHKSIIANLKALNKGTNEYKTDSSSESHEETKEETKEEIKEEIKDEINEWSLSKSKINFIKKHWVNQLSKDRLEYMALLYPIKHWKQLIDIFHLKPNDFLLSWFTCYIFTKEFPEGSIIDICNKITPENIKETLINHKFPYDFLRLKYKDLLTPEIMKAVLSYTELNCLIRHWDKFNTEDNTQQVIKRINNDEVINMPYGELMKRIQMFREKGDSPSLVGRLLEIAETKLCGYKLDIDQPVVVLGDASGSMDVAVKTSSIITSILVKVCNAKMHLFRDKDEFIEHPPTNVSEVLDSMKKFKAYGCTAPCASLYPYYKNKEVVKTFILVTD
ncbi:MAG: hypothetical protein MUO21_11015, partial [Nitrososphaeraceae archaeon]|nr:hypothetical protein [Nitrososphaeraceae archaeon]